MSSLGLLDPDQENALLVGIIDAISAGPDLGPMAASVAELIVGATASDVCFVHVLDDSGGALTVTSRPGVGTTVTATVPSGLNTPRG